MNIDKVRDALNLVRHMLIDARNDPSTTVIGIIDNALETITSENDAVVKTLQYLNAELDNLDEQINMRLKAEKERDEWKANAEQYKLAMDELSARQIERIEHEHD